MSTYLVEEALAALGPSSSGLPPPQSMRCETPVLPEDSGCQSCYQLFIWDFSGPLPGVLLLSQWRLLSPDSSSYFGARL